MIAKHAKQTKNKIKINLFLFYMQINVPQIGTNILHAPKDELVAQNHKFKQSVE
jgi:hypothetical protein